MPELRHIASTIDEIVQKQGISTVSGDHYEEASDPTASSAISASSGRIVTLELEMEIGASLLSLASIPPLPDTLILEHPKRRVWVYQDGGVLIGSYRDELPWLGERMVRVPGFSLHGSRFGALRVVELLEDGFQWRDAVGPAHRDPSRLPEWVEAVRS